MPANRATMPAQPDWDNLPAEVASLPLADVDGESLIHHEAVASLLGVKASTLRQLRKDGALGPVRRRQGNVPYYAPATVAQAWLRRQGNAASGEAQMTPSDALAAVTAPALDTLAGVLQTVNAAFVVSETERKEARQDREDARALRQSVQELSQRVLTLETDKSRLEGEARQLRQELETGREELETARVAAAKASKPFWRR